MQYHVTYDVNIYFSTYTLLTLSTREQVSLTINHRISDIGCAPNLFSSPATRTTTKSTKTVVASLAVLLLMSLQVTPAQSQSLAPPPPTRTPEQELRRLDERDRSQREKRERAPDVRLTPVAPPESARLPLEANCFVINQVLLKTAPGEKPSVAADFAWLIEQLAGDKFAGLDGNDAPQGRCLGSEGINLILKRAQDALVARGFVTSRIVAEPQEMVDAADAAGLFVTGVTA